MYSSYIYSKIRRWLWGGGETRFISLNLIFLNFYREMGVPAACTVRSNRMEKCPLKTEKELRKEGRGSMDFQQSEEGIIVVKWFDNKEVTIASNSYGVEPVTQVRRWDKAKKEYVMIPRPALVGAYNSGMGGVDAADAKLSFYRIKTKSPKWYKRVLYHFTDVCTVNSYILFKKAAGKEYLPLYQYKMEVALALMYAESFDRPLSAAAILLRRGYQEAENGDPVGDADPAEAVRLDGHNHWPQNVAQQQRRCKLPGCKQRSVVWCTKCRVYLCLKKDRNCFIEYHTV